MYTNADTLTNKLNELAVEATTLEPDLILVTEVKPKFTRCPLSVDSLILQNYQTPVTNLSTGDRGIAVYAKEGSGLTVEELSMRTPYSESIWLKISIANDHRSVPMVIGCIYRSPQKSSEINNNALNDLIIEATDRFRNLVIVGDFNFPEINWDSKDTNKPPSHPAARFLETCMDSFLHQCVSLPTRQRGQQEPSLLDLVLTNKPELVSDIEHRPPIGLSDHDVLFFEIKPHHFSSNTTDPSQGKSSPCVYRYSSGDYVNMRVEAGEWNIRQDLESSTDVNYQWGIIAGNLQSLTDKYVPKQGHNKSRGKKPLWMTKHALAKVKKKHQSYRRYLQTKDGQDYLAYVANRNQAQKEIRRAVHEYENSIARGVKANPKGFWAYYKSKTKAKDNIPHLISQTGCMSSCDQEKADIFNNFFSSVFTREDAANLPQAPSYRLQSCISNIVLTEDEVLKKLSEINVNKSKGPDNIHPKVIYELRNELAAPLTILFNNSLETGVVPSEWKVAKVTPLFKKGDKHQASNYRPISLTSVIGKLLESLVKDKLLTHLEANNLICSNQHGFVPKKSCETNLLESLDLFTNVLDGGGAVDSILLDFAKAFDSVPHRRLLLKAESVGITGTLRSWLESFLSNRTQYVEINGCKSTSAVVVSGVPQGSVLGPLLFVIYINDLPMGLTNSFTKLFADDANVAKPLASRTNDIKNRELQADLFRLCDWSDIWLLGFQVPKCKFLPLGHSPNYTYSMRDRNGHIIELERVDSDKSLGVTIDRELKFSKHIELITARAMGVLYTIKRVITSRDRHIIIPLYKALVRPILEYGQVVWSPGLQCDIEKVEKIQRRATRLIPEIRNLSYGERLKVLNLPSLSDRRKRGDMIQLYKYVHGLVRGSLPVQFNQRQSRGHNCKLFIPRAQKNIRKNFFINRSAEYWNNLPHKLVNAPSLNAFKAGLDKLWANSDL